MRAHLCFLALAAATVLGGCAHHRMHQGQQALPKDLLAQFKAADTDGDESLSFAEVQAGMPEMAASFAAVDTDGNQQITLSELRSYLEWKRVLAMPPAGSRAGTR